MTSVKTETTPAVMYQVYSGGKPASLPMDITKAMGVARRQSKPKADGYAVIALSTDSTAHIQEWRDGKLVTRSISAIAREIRRDWKEVWYAAKPYLAAMTELVTVKDVYGADDAEGIVLRFLGNAKNWKGPVAQRLKAELNEMLNEVA